MNHIYSLYVGEAGNHMGNFRERVLLNGAWSRVDDNEISICLDRGGGRWLEIRCDVEAAVDMATQIVDAVSEAKSILDDRGEEDGGEE